jgi:LEA14-like dessication related protein
MKKLFIYGTIGLGITALITYINQVGKLTDKLYYKARGLKIKQLNARGIIVGIKMLIENKSDLKIKIIGYNFNIYADGKFLTNVKTSTTFNIKPFQTSEIEFDATINPDTIGGITNALINSQKIKDISLKTEGTITIKKFGMPIRVPISYTETIGDYMK